MSSKIHPSLRLCSNKLGLWNGYGFNIIQLDVTRFAVVVAVALRL